MKCETKTQEQLDEQFRFNAIDENDRIYLEDLLRRQGSSLTILSGEPIGWAKGKPHFNATRFILSNGQTSTVFHVKPIYYHTSWGAVRPLSEVTNHHGNKRITLKEGWETKVDFGYLTWLVKRCQLIGGGVSYDPSKIPLFLNTVSTFYPDPSPETTSVDGYCNYGNNAVWATAHDATDSATADDVTTPDRVE